MPWSKENYPVSMKNLPDAVREKAIEIANAILEDGHTDEGIAIATGISRAKGWVKKHRGQAGTYKRRR
jgi:uncharacterized protein YdaT